MYYIFVSGCQIYIKDLKIMLLDDMVFLWKVQELSLFCRIYAYLKTLSIMLLNSKEFFLF